MSKVNLSLSSVQIREIRINSITGFQGGAEELVRCSRDGIEDNLRAFTQCVGCATSKASRVAVESF
ncbi:MAG: hypothetical protein LBP30_05415 [Clostridiales Family XIII bacterium]|jgi:nitrogenase molybdenum-iron protein alpha chain|nr:hypothetical protein [Clostridiales Family XIII bacterium]